MGDRKLAAELKLQKQEFDKAATKIQACQRGKRDRKRVTELRKQKAKSEERPQVTALRGWLRLAALIFAVWLSVVVASKILEVLKHTIGAAILCAYVVLSVTCSFLTISPEDIISPFVWSST